MDPEKELIESNIEAYLEQHQNKELLRFVAVGSVDDGKSTLIGRLLHDTHGVYEDQLNAVKRASTQKNVEIDFSLFTDGLKAEREQGITIDVAYRYFSTAKRKFIIADTPGHVQYTRNMATGASTANVGIILIDARLGVVQQSRRHAYIASLLGIPHLAVAVNKMDLRDYDQSVFDAIRADFSRFAERLAFKDVKFVPISALRGDNVVHTSEQTPWYSGGTLLEYLEWVPVANDRNHDDFRYPVQYVIRPHLDYRSFAGEIASGVVRKGDTVTVLPSRRTTRVRAIDTYEGERETAFAPMSVTLRLEDAIDVSRGDMLVHSNRLPHIGQQFDAMMVWLSERPLDRDKSYFIKHTTQLTRAEVEDVRFVVDLETLEQVPSNGLELNDIARIKLRCRRPLFFDAYAKNRSTGAFVLIDSITNNTVAAGMIVEPERDVVDAPGTRQAHTQVSPKERRERLGQRGALVWVTGPVAALNTELAYAVERRLFDSGHVGVVVDPHDGLGAASANIAGDSPPTVELARRLVHAGVIAVFAVGGLRRADRAIVRAGIANQPFLEVFVAGALGAEPRSGEYVLAQEGFEAPDAPEVTISVESGDLEAAAEAVVAVLVERGIFSAS